MSNSCSNIHKLRIYPSLKRTKGSMTEPGYKHALDNMLKDECTELFKAYTIHEKKFGE